MRLLEDNPDNTNDSGYYGSESGVRGEELENLAQHYLRGIGIIRAGAMR